MRQRSRSNRMARSRSSRSEVPLPPTMSSTMSLVAAFLRPAATNRAPDPRQDCLDLLVARRSFEAGRAVEVADGRQAPDQGCWLSVRGLPHLRGSHTPLPATRPMRTKPRSSHQHSNTRQSLPYAVSVVLALLARAKSAASSSVVASSAGPGGRLGRAGFPVRPPVRMRVIGVAITCARYISSTRYPVNTSTRY